MTEMREFIIRGVLVGTSSVCDVVVKGGKVTRLLRAGKRPVDFGSSDSWIGPTLFDIQVNGLKGIDLQGIAITPEGVRRISAHLAANGVSAWIPTLITGPLDAMEHGCRVLAEALRDPMVKRAVPGIHLEGPVISPVDGPRGAHPKQYVRLPSLKDFDRLSRAAEGTVLYTTVAPELPGAIPYIRALVKRGVLVSLGHHAASREIIGKAVDAGAKLCTHLGNGSASMMHRHHNPLWPQLAEDRLMASLIADLHHLTVPMMQAFVRAKGVDRIILTSDCVDLTGMKPGAYALFGAKVELKRNGKICLLGTDLLAGSGLMLLEGVTNTWKNTDLSLEEAFRCASTNPARLFGLRRRFSLPKVGARADFVAFDMMPASGGLEKPRVCASFVNGALASG